MIVLIAAVIMVTVILGMYAIDWNRGKEEIQATWTKDERGHYINGCKTVERNPKK